MDHMQYLMVRSQDATQQRVHHPLESPDDDDYDHMSGHALMATAPPKSHITHKPSEPYPYQMPDLPTPDLKRLLELSSRLPFDQHYGEITPVMAWTMVLTNQRCPELTTHDFERIKTDLTGKVKCYG